MTTTTAEQQYHQFGGIAGWYLPGGTLWHIVDTLRGRRGPSRIKGGRPTRSTQNCMSQYPPIAGR